MPRPRPLQLHKEINRHGNAVWYFREGKGPRIRIKGVYGIPEFDAAYQDALKGESPLASAKTSKGSLQWLWGLYRQATAWTELSMATRKQRENIMRGIIETSGNQPLSKITSGAVKQGIDRRRKPYTARHFVDTLHGLFKWALNAQHITSDPTIGHAVAKPKTRN